MSEKWAKRATSPRAPEESNPLFTALHANLSCSLLQVSSNDRAEKTSGKNRGRYSFKKFRESCDVSGRKRTQDSMRRWAGKRVTEQVVRPESDKAEALPMREEGAYDEEVSRESVNAK